MPGCLSIPELGFDATQKAVLDPFFEFVLGSFALKNQFVLHTLKS
jgi:hypothetical protein